MVFEVIGCIDGLDGHYLQHVINIQMTAIDAVVDEQDTLAFAF